MNDQPIKKTGNREGRSPGYPSINLETALDRARLLKDREPRHFAHISTIFAYWNYGPKSSTGLLTLAALKKFGLVQDRGVGDAREAKITDLAWRILEDNRPNSTERITLIQEAALTPPIHRKLWNEYKGLLPSDETLRYRLRTVEKFTLSAVDDFIREFRDTIDFAKLGESVNISEQQEEKMPPAQEVPMTAVPEMTHTFEDHKTRVYVGGNPAQEAPKESLRGEIAFPLSPTRWVCVSLPQQLTRKEWARMLKKLEMFKDGFMDPLELDEEDE